MSDKELLLEIHQMLVKICNYIDRTESDEYKQKDYNMQFLLNVVADMYVDKLNQLKR